MSYGSEKSTNQYKCFDLLEVGPPVLEHNRLTVPYKIIIGDDIQTTEWTIEYDSNVFDVDSPQVDNLVSLIAIQPALNFGMFSKRVILRGFFDNHDRKAIRNLGEILSREVYINRMYEPNPYLRKEDSLWEAPTKKALLKAELIVTGENKEPYIHWDQWQSSRERHGVLVDGTRESLLSFGMLRELGDPTFAFVHLPIEQPKSSSQDLYDKLSQSYPEEVFCIRSSLDELYHWFKVQIPYIMEDYSEIRHQTSPLAVWKKGISLFCALPLIKKLGIRRIVSGNTYETTEKVFINNISHNAGNFENSYYADTFLSRFFQQKKWGVHTFSILRSLSQFLSEKMLLERYPELHELEFACSRPVVKDQNVRRCGWCHSCGAHQSLLVAHNSSIEKFGYNAEQLKYALSLVESRKIEWDEKEIDQLLLALSHQNAIDLKRPPKVKLDHLCFARISREKSPSNSMPDSLREPIYRLLSQHVEGILMRVGRGWKPIESLDSSKPSSIYPFEQDGEDHFIDDSSDELDASNKSTCLWGQLSWQQAQKKLSTTDVAILPIGGVIQYGPHLPLDTGGHLVEELAKRAAFACRDPQPLVLPLLPYGVSGSKEDFVGVLSLSSQTFVSVIFEIAKGLIQNSIKKLLILNRIPSNVPSLLSASQMISEELGILVCVDSGESYQKDIRGALDSQFDTHAGEVDTSLSLYSRPQYVQMGLARRTLPQFTNRFLTFQSQRKVPWYIKSKKHSTNGIMGDPTKASLEKGEKFWEIMISHTVALIEDIIDLRLDEIYSIK